MIPNIVRGDRMVGLISYLAGPGRANEHTNPHVVAGSDGVMAWHADGQLDHQAAMELGKTLDRPRTVHEATMKGGHVWHCSLSVASVEGELGDETWGEIAASFIRHMGFDTQDDTKAPMRWAAIHHGQSANGNDHIHLAVQLVREDGTKADVGFDFSRAQKAAREIEREFGLAELETEKSKISEPGYSRAEYEATARRRAEAKYETSRHPEQLGWHDLSKQERGEYIAEIKRELKAEGMPRDHLKVEVRAAASMSNTEAEFVGRLHAQGILMKPFYKDPEQTIVGGYQVAMPSKYGEQPWYIAGGSLGHDLSLNRLRNQWQSSPELRQEAFAAWQRVGRNLAPNTATSPNISPDVMNEQARLLSQHFKQLRTIPLADRDRWAVEAHHLSGLVASWAKAGGPHAEQLGRAARSLGRSASTKHHPSVSHSKPQWIRDASLVLAQAATGGKGPAAQMLMMKQILQTVQAVAKVHDATQELRRAQELRLTLEHDLSAVQNAVVQPVGSSPDVQSVLAGTKQLSAQQIAKPPSPIPSAIPKKSETPTQQPGRDEISR